MTDQHLDKLDEWIAEMLRQEQAHSGFQYEAFRDGLERKIASAQRWERFSRVAKWAAAITGMTVLIRVALLTPSKALFAWGAASLFSFLGIAVLAGRPASRRPNNSIRIDAEEPTVSGCLRAGPPTEPTVRPGTGAKESAEREDQGQQIDQPSGKPSRTDAKGAGEVQRQGRPVRAPAAKPTEIKSRKTGGWHANEKREAYMKSTFPSFPRARRKWNDKRKLW